MTTTRTRLRASSAVVTYRDDCVFIATPKQEQFLRDLFSGEFRVMALGGAIRGTKTFALLWAIVLLARFFPRSRWAIVRKDLPTIRRTVVPSFEKLRPSNFIGPLNRSTWTYPCANGSEIILFSESLSEDPEHNRWRGLEVNGFGLEEANELAQSSFHKALERAGSWRIPPSPEQRARGEEPVEPPPIVLLTFNPDDGYVRSDFYEPHREQRLPPRWYFLPLTPRDNPYVTDEQWSIWKRLPPTIYKRFIEGDWGAIMHPRQLIAFEWVHDALDPEKCPRRPGRLREALDVARSLEGEGDASVYARVDGNTLTRLDERHVKQLAELSQEAIIRGRASRIDGNDYRIDAVNLGAGVADNMAIAGYPIYRFIAGATALPRPIVVPYDPRTMRGGPAIDQQALMAGRFKFKNIRTQAWWECARALQEGRHAIALEKDVDPRAFSRLVQDLTAVRYIIKGDLTIQLEHKDETRTRIGRSPDYGDAYVMAHFDVPADDASVATSRSTFTG